MSENTEDEFTARYDYTSNIRKRAIDHFSAADETLHLTLADKDSASLLIKLLDGEDKQTIARQKNKTDEKLADGLGVNVHAVADSLFQKLTGLRGEPDASKAPDEKIDLDVKVEDGEMRIGEDPELNFENLVPKNEG